MTISEEISWVGSGWLGGRPAEQAWGILFAVLIAGLLAILVSYAFTLVTLSSWQRWVLRLMRLLFWAGLLLLLAAPLRIVRTFDQPVRSRRPLAVLVDRSDSMTARDNRQQRRLDDALIQWRGVEPAAAETFSSVTSFVFARGLAAGDTGLLDGTRTDFYSSLQEVLAKAPAGGWGGIVALTDGIDTSGVDPVETQRKIMGSALNASTPLYFVVGRNRTTEPEFFRLREFTVPPKTPPSSTIHLEAIFEGYQAKVATLPVTLTVNGTERPAGSIRLEAGRHLATWSADEAVDAPGTVTVEVHAGAEMARAEVKIEAPPSNRVLFVPGAIGWGYRFFADALAGSPIFTVTPAVVLPPAGTMLPAATPRLPDAAGLKPLGFVVLESTAAAQMSPASQQDLEQWVKEGGVLILLASDADTSRRLAGSELEKILPVVFPSAERPPVVRPTIPVAPESLPEERGELVRAQPPRLLPFVWENEARAREIFADTPAGSLADQTPTFMGFRSIERIKPGAEVLARHPEEKGNDGRGAVLLAVQRFGHGKSVAFATDALWRWRLTAANQRGSDRFWGNFLSWLNRDREPGFSFEHPPVHATIGQNVILRLVGADAKKLDVAASLGGQRLTLDEKPGDDLARSFPWRPSAAGLWQLEARDPDGNVARAWVSVVRPAGKTGELPSGPPEEELLRRLAEKTGGTVLGNPPAAWRQHQARPQLLTERREPLWHQEWIFAALLAVYGLEMLLRRRWQLL